MTRGPPRGQARPVLPLPAEPLTVNNMAVADQEMLRLLGTVRARPGLEAHREAGTDRLANLVGKDPLFDLCWNNPRQLSAIAHVLGWQPEKVFSLNGRSARPGQGHQNLHVDWSGAVAAGDYQITNSIWMLDDFTAANGATRVVPGSHRWGQVPQDAMADPGTPHPDEVLVLGSGGTCVGFNSHLWHGGTLNRTSAPRRAIHAALVPPEH